VCIPVVSACLGKSNCTSVVPACKLVNVCVSVLFLHVLVHLCVCLCVNCVSIVKPRTSICHNNDGTCTHFFRVCGGWGSQTIGPMDIWSHAIFARLDVWSHLVLPDWTFGPIQFLTRRTISPSCDYIFVKLLYYLFI